MPHHDVVVIGGGLSGLSNAWHLQQQGADVAMIESSTKVGGMLSTDKSEGWLADLGANSAILKPALQTLIQQLNLEEAVVSANAAAKKRYVYHEGKLHELPLSLKALWHSSLFPFSAKLRLLKEPFIKHASAARTSVSECFRHRLGDCITERAIDPFVSGTWAGDLNQLAFDKAFASLDRELAKHGSLFKVMQQRAQQSTPIISFRWGMEQLVSALENALAPNVNLNQSVLALKPTAAGWTVTTKDESFHASNVVLSVPVQQGFPWLSVDDRGIQSALDEYPTAPTCVLAYRFKRADVEHALDGFGVLFPRNQGIRTLGVLFSSTMFTNRCADSEVVLTAFIGGMHDASVTKLSVESLSQIVLAELTPLLALRTQPISFKYKYWQKGIPQYACKHHDQYERWVKQKEQQHPGLWMSSNYHKGVAVSDRITAAQELASRLSASIG